MQYKITGYKPEKFFHFFEEFSAVPRGSGFEKDASDFLVKFAEDRNLEVIQDEAYNVIIRKPGSKGAEDKPTVILQGHMDMVCEKVAGCTHDFHTEGIDMYVEDGWLTANGTTLGADDGVADAFMMTVLDDDSMVHPPLECVFTTSEEVGLIGANALDYSQLKGRLMINLDSETEGVATVSCAGGLEYTLTKPLNKEHKTGSVLTLDISGLKGGHSGADIHLERTNAIRLAARAVNRLMQECRKAQLVEFSSGSKSNAIPREAAVSVFVPDLECADKIEKILSELCNDFRNEICHAEPDFVCEAKRTDNTEADVLTREDSRDIVSAVLLAPNGVQRRDPNMNNFVLTSLNLGIISTENDAKLVFAPRSSVNSLQDYTKERLALTAETFGFNVTMDAEYPGWEKVEDSELRKTFEEAYKELFDEEIKVEGIHAGLECGLFFAALPGLDPVSIGPTLLGVHTPDEKMDLESMEKTFVLVKDVLERLAI